MDNQKPMMPLGTFLTPSIETSQEESRMLWLLVFILRIKNKQGFLSFDPIIFSFLLRGHFRSVKIKHRQGRNRDASTASFMNDRSKIIYANGLGWVSSFPTICSSWLYLNLKTIFFGVCWQFHVKLKGSREYFPKNSKALLRSPRTYWHCSLTVLSYTEDEALLESYFLFAKADAGETDEQGFRFEESWVVFPAQP